MKKYNKNYETIEIRQNLSKDLLTYKDHSRKNPVASDVWHQLLLITLCMYGIYQNGKLILIIFLEKIMIILLETNIIKT